MSRPAYISIEDYDYLLPEERIAKYPLAERDRSKLLVFKDEDIQQHPFSEAGTQLDPGDQLFYNNTKVVQARLQFQKETGALIEIFILKPFKPKDYQQAFGSEQDVLFTCLVGNARKWKSGELILDLTERGISANLSAKIIERKDDKFIIHFSWDAPSTSFAEILEKAGSTPIPPYLKRKAEKSDTTNYQTVYAQQNGSVAAPTAGLHFTDKVLEEISTKGIDTIPLTLHVGAGTFIPVKEKNAASHEMHAEEIAVNKELLLALSEEKRRRIAVGTTSTRSLESLYWLGVKAKRDAKLDFKDLFLNQWEAYDMPQDISLKTSMQSLLSLMEKRGISDFRFHTRIMIVPGYRFRVIQGLFTNFHQPKSTLLLLIGALVGEHWKEIYNYAMQHDFRFLSYGDSSLLWLKS